MSTGFPDYSLDVSGTLQVVNGGTGRINIPANNLLVGRDTAALALIAPGALGAPLRANGAAADPVFSGVRLIVSDVFTDPLILDNSTGVLACSIRYRAAGADKWTAGMGVFAGGDLFEIFSHTASAVRARIRTDTLGLAQIKGKVDSTGLVASVPTTTLYTPATAGFYRISAHVSLTTADATGTLTVTSFWTEDGFGWSQPLITNMPTTISTPQSGRTEFFVTAGTAIQYSTTYVAGAGGVVYSLHIRLEGLEE